jgi:hypothetical protein
MKIGDLVEVLVFTRDVHTGVIVNTWTNHKNKLQGVDILLSNGEIKNVGTWACKVISESR